MSLEPFGRGRKRLTACPVKDCPETFQPGKNHEVADHFYEKHLPEDLGLSPLEDEALKVDMSDPGRYRCPRGHRIRFRHYSHDAECESCGRYYDCGDLIDASEVAGPQGEIPEETTRRTRA